MEVKVIKEPDTALIEKWNDFVLNHPNGNFFQSPDAFELFDSVSNYRPILIVAKEGEKIAGILLAVLMKEPGLKGYFSKRCLVWGGPLARNNEQEIVKLLLVEFNRYVNKKAIYSEFRNLYDMSNFKLIFAEQNYVYEDHLNFILNISNPEMTFSNFKSEKRRQIRRALRNYVSFELIESEIKLKELYAIFKYIYKTRVRKPLPSFEFFVRLLKLKSVFVIGVIQNGKIIGGSVLPSFNNTIYDWYRCGLDESYKHLYPSTVAVWAGISFGHERGFKYFDFMGAGKPDQEYGVRKFKEQFGGEMVNYGRYIKINLFLLYKIGKLGLYFYRKF